MKFGRNSANERVSADDAQKGQEYFCPCCNASLILKQGQIKDWHFAHEKDADCDAFTENKMTEWHIRHQNEFPEECREVRMEIDGVVHIADVFCNGVIWEFQHSPMSNEVFEERSLFYSQKGTLIWVFDMRDQWMNDRIQWVQKRIDGDYGYFEWAHANKVLGQYDFSKGQVLLFIELDDSGWGCLVNWNPSGMKYFNGVRMGKDKIRGKIEEIHRSRTLMQCPTLEVGVLYTNSGIIQARKEEAERQEAYRRMQEAEAQRKAKQEAARKKINSLDPEIRKLEADAEWANQIYSAIQKELGLKRKERDECRKAIGWF